MKSIILSIVIVIVIVAVAAMGIFTPSNTPMSDEDIVAQKSAMSAHAINGWENNTVSTP